MSPTKTSSCSPSIVGQLRLLQTTDLHMQLLAYDYFSDRPDDGVGLIGLADRIVALKEDQDTTTLYFDTGDLIQGNPLADTVAAALQPTQTHPMIAALNLLGCDAMTLGNHEFDYGLPKLRTILSKAAFPVVSANIIPCDAPPIGTDFVVLDRNIHCNDGVTRKIKIGVVGFGPPQIASLDSDKIDTRDIVIAAKEVVPKIRAAGADLVVALCHSGLGATAHTARMENAAIPLAAVEGIDVLFTGHTHESFPDPIRPTSDCVDPIAGTLHGKPTLMAAYCGKSLGVINLTLEPKDGRWDIKQHRISFDDPQPAGSAPSKLREKLARLVAEPHAATLAKMNTPIAQTSIPIHSYFATIQPELSQQILARAAQQAIQNALRGTPHAHLPVLAAKSSFRFGGRSGFGHYIDIPEGPITLRDATAIFPFVDRLFGMRRTGAQLRRWLERGASHYNQMTADTRNQHLLNPLSVGYNCDTIFGLSYQINLREPACFDPHGREKSAASSRIKALCYKGKPVLDTDIFVVATNSFRAKGGGGFPAFPPSDILHRSSDTLQDILIAHLKEVDCIAEPVHHTWSFSPIKHTSAYFQSSPKARRHITGPISYVGQGIEGFDTYQINF